MPGKLFYRAALNLFVSHLTNQHQFIWQIIFPPVRSNDLWKRVETRPDSVEAELRHIRFLRTIRSGIQFHSVPFWIKFDVGMHVSLMQAGRTYQAIHNAHCCCDLRSSWGTCKMPHP